MTSKGEKRHFFYGRPVLRDREQQYIEELLAQYRHEPVDEKLKQKVWDDLQREKAHGRITIPFKVVMRNDATGKFPPLLEVILDTKV
jgi:predicted metal-dependent hydrolase